MSYGNGKTESRNLLYGGEGSALWLGDSCYLSMESAKKSAAKKLDKVKGIKEIVESLLFAPEQGELFL
jgi:hypothetical protein